MGLFGGGALGAIGGVLGAIGGGSGSPTSGFQSGNTSSSVSLRDFEELQKGASGLEKNAYQSNLSNFQGLQDLINAGPGQSAITQAAGANDQYAQLLQSFLQNGGLPTQAQQGYAQNYAQSMFNPQRVALQQSFVDQNQQAKRLQARLGRGGFDPILQNKLATEQTRQTQQLNAQQGAFAAQTANGMPQQQMQFGNALTSLRNNLAQQALQNRQTILALGQSLTGSERQYRLDTATRNGTSYQSFGQKSGGGLGGALSGALAGIGGGLGIAGKLGLNFGGGDSSGGGQMMAASNFDPSNIA